MLYPHVYGPDVFEQPAANFPDNLPAIWDARFGNLVKAGIAVVVGETGGILNDDWTTGREDDMAILHGYSAGGTLPRLRTRRLR